MNEFTKQQLPAINNSEGSEYTVHLIARVKAKWGISYGMLANYLNISVKQSMEWSEKDNAPIDIRGKIIKLDIILERIMQEQKTLGIDSTYVQALKHEIELDRKQINSLQSEQSELRSVNHDLLFYQGASFWKRLGYLFAGRINGN